MSVIDQWELLSEIDPDNNVAMTWGESGLRVAVQQECGLNGVIKVSAQMLIPPDVARALLAWMQKAVGGE